MAADIYLVRHGATDWTQTGRHTSHTNVPLNRAGERQARRLGRRLRGIGLRAAYSSDMDRVLRTAQLAGFAQPEVTPLLREYDYGEYEGMTTRQIRETKPGWLIYVDDCPGGETPAEVYDRARRCLELLTSAGGGSLVAFSHGHFLRALAVAWIGAPIAAANGLALDTAGLCILRDGDHGRVIQLWNFAPD